ncbi:unnamed protein product [Tetraodon nigroviridis]|uniref:Protein MMS22-like n=1 Tax=Tetraodon nigroviridis TaxID=99883 RepID=Q4SMQ1_TETNG|nr:unnamed protein product [Tetraodon nigroviridis]
MDDDFGQSLTPPVSPLAADSLCQAGNLHYEAEDLRQQCISFLQYIKVFLYSSPDTDAVHPFDKLDAQLPSKLLEELFGITLLIGRLKDLPASVQSAFTMSNQGKVVYAHQFVNLTGENLTDTSLFEEHLCNLLCDLTGLAMGKYSKSFWSYMNSLLRPLVSEKPAAEQLRGLPAQCKDPLGFTWWLVIHVSMLGQYNRNGTPQTEQGLLEEQIRMHVHCCLSLSLLWEPSTSAVSALWEYYSKNLNASFSIPWLGVSGVGTLYKTPMALLDQARSCCSPSPLHSPGHTQLYRAASSFHIFLRVLALCLAQDGVGGVPQRQIKGRIYSKFSPKKMQDLSETGLMNFLLLFLVVARQVELEDVASRACELLGFLPSNCSTGHRTLVWRGQLSLLLLFQERGLDVGAQASWLASSFNETAKEFYSKTTEVSRKLALWRPLSSYLEGVAEVFETSANLNLSQEKLLNEGFDWLLPACRVSELNSALSFLQVVLAQLSPSILPPQHTSTPLQHNPHQASAVKERHLAVAAALWSHFYPFLRNLRLSQTPPALLADAAAGRVLQKQLCELTRLVLKLPEVDGLLHRAGLQATVTKPEPASVLEVFVKAVGVVYGGLQVLSERSSMATRALDYIGDIMKYIKPSLVSKSQEGLQLVYWAVGCIVKHWSPLLATSKAQQLLFRIVDGLLLPHNITQQDKALRDSLHLYLQGLSVSASLSQSQGAYLKEQLRLVTCRYLDHFLPASPSVGIIANHPVLLSACEVHPTPRGAALRRTILRGALVICEGERRSVRPADLQRPGDGVRVRSPFGSGSGPHPLPQPQTHGTQERTGEEHRLEVRTPMNHTAHRLQLFLSCLDNEQVLCNEVQRFPAADCCISVQQERL